MAKSLPQPVRDDQNRRYGPPEYIQGLLNQAKDLESKFGSEPSFFEWMRQQENEIHGITPKLPDYTKPVDPAPVPSFKKDQFLLASNLAEPEDSPWQGYKDNIMEQVAELATLSQKINIILNSPNTSEAEKSQFRNILSGIHHRMNQLMGQGRNRRPERNNGLSI
jgi:hypothetical protein